MVRFSGASTTSPINSNNSNNTMVRFTLLASILLMAMGAMGAKPLLRQMPDTTPAASPAVVPEPGTSQRVTDCERQYSRCGDYDGQSYGDCCAGLQCEASHSSYGKYRQRCVQM